MVSLKQLIYRHPEHRKHAKRWMTLSRLADGGSSVDTEFKKQLLINPANDQDTLLAEERAKLAPYDPIIGSILMKLVSQLTSDAASYEGDNDAFWDNEFLPKGALIIDDSGQQNRSTFHALLNRAIFKGLVQGAMIGIVDEPSDATEQPYAYLIDRWNLWDWDSDKDGLNYAKIHSFEMYRKSWRDKPIPRHCFLIYEKIENKIVASKYYVTPNNPQGIELSFTMDDLENYTDDRVTITAEKESVEIFGTSNGLYRFPVVIRTLEKPLCVADQLYDQAVSLLNHTAASEWALIQTNYAILVFGGVDAPHVEGNNNPAKFQSSGNGYWWELQPGVTAEWLVRPGADIQLSIEYQNKLKQKMLDLIHKVAETAANSYAMRMQSGESKKEGRRDLDILLEVYGEDLRTFAKGILDVAAVARNRDTQWVVKGFSDYNTAGLAEAIEEYMSLDKAGLQSPTLIRESRKAIAEKAVSSLNLKPNLMAEITTELENDPSFTLSAEGMQFWIELAKINMISPEDLYLIAEKAGLKPTDMGIEEMLENIGMNPETPQTNNPVIANDAES